MKSRVVLIATCIGLTVATPACTSSCGHVPSAAGEAPRRPHVRKARSMADQDKFQLSPILQRSVGGDVQALNQLLA